MTAGRSMAETGSASARAPAKPSYGAGLPLWRSLSLYGRLALAGLAGWTLLFTLDLAVGLYQAKGQVQDMLAESARIEAENLAQSLAAPLAANDSALAQQILQRRIDQGDLLSISYRGDGSSLVFSCPPGRARRPQWFADLVGLHAVTGAASMALGGGRAGQLRVRVSPLARETVLWRIISRRVVFFCVLLAVMAYVMHWLLRSNFRGLAALRAGAGAFDAGRLDARVIVEGNAPPELQAAAAAFNHMADKLEALVRDLSREKGRWAVTLASIADGVVVVGESGRILYCNPAAATLARAAATALEDRPFEAAFPLRAEGGAPAQFADLFVCTSVSGGGCTFDLRRADGSEVPVQLSASPLLEGDFTGHVVVLRDESERHAMLEELRVMAYTDRLTGLPNRFALESYLQKTLLKARESASSHAFCYLDLDQFKLVNDTCGHAAGDEVLADIARRLRDALRPEDYLARLGGDEFGVVLLHVSEAQALAVCEALVGVVRARQFHLQGRNFGIDACMGVAFLQGEELGAGDLLARADKACFAAKSHGGGRIEVYRRDHPTYLRIEQEMEWVSRFAEAFAENRFKLYRQPILALDGSTAAQHYEVLLRLMDGGELVSPASFFPAAERYGLAPNFDRWVLRTLFAYLRTHPQDDAMYAVNLSGRTLADEDFLGVVSDLLESSGVPGSRLIFEITETAAVNNLALARRFIEFLRARGCRFALDDFGCGMSSFSYLRELPVDYLKIDGSFVRGLGEAVNFVIVSAIAKIGRELGIRTVAEQAENAEAVALVRRLGVDYVQGYAVGYPQPFMEEAGAVARALPDPNGPA